MSIIQFVRQLVNQIVLWSVIVSSHFLLTCVHSDVCICLHNFFFNCCRMICRISLQTFIRMQNYLFFVKQSMNYHYSIYIKFIYIALYYYTILYYIILYYITHLTFFLPLIYKLFKGSNGRVKLERSRQWQLDNSWGKASERGLWWRWQHHLRFAFLCLYFL